MFCDADSARMRCAHITTYRIRADEYNLTVNKYVIFALRRGVSIILPIRGRFSEIFTGIFRYIVYRAIGNGRDWKVMGDDIYFYFNGKSKMNFVEWVAIFLDFDICCFAIDSTRSRRKIFFQIFLFL